MAEHHDVAIAGGGVMGCAVAYFLASDPEFAASVLVVERDPSYEACATTRSWGGIRQQFSTPENVKMSLFAGAFVQQARELLAVDGDAPDLGFKQHGYLFLATEAGLPVLQENCALQQELGGTTELIDQDGLAARFPWLNLEGLVAGAFGPANEGWIDPSALLHGFRKKARALGVRFVSDEVVGGTVDKGRVAEARLAKGGAVSCDVLVNAAGPQAGRLAALFGIELPVRPRKRMSYVFDCREDLLSAPLTIDVTGVAFRPEGKQYIAIVSPPEDQDPDSNDLEEDYAPFEEVIWPTLAHRVPAFEAIKLAGAWAGHYDFNTFDHNAVIGRHPEIENFLFCNGFSGHGVQQSPAAGRGVAELIAHGRYRTLDLTRFGFERIPAGNKIIEKNVV